MFSMFLLTDVVLVLYLSEKRSLWNDLYGHMYLFSFSVRLLFTLFPFFLGIVIM